MRPRLAFVPSNNMWGGQGHARDQGNKKDWAKFPVVLAGIDLFTVSDAISVPYCLGANTG